MRIMKPLTISVILLNLTLSAVAADFCGYQPGLKTLGANNTSADDFNTRAQAFNAARNACPASACFHSTQLSCASYFRQTMDDCTTAASDVKNNKKNAHKEARNHCINEYSSLQTIKWPSGFAEESSFACGYSQSYISEVAGHPTAEKALFQTAKGQCTNDSHAKKLYDEWYHGCDTISGLADHSTYMHRCGEHYLHWAKASNAAYCNKTPKPSECSK